jgi:HEAT repeat protein
MARYRACLAINIIGYPGKDAVPELIHCLHDYHYMVRQMAALALSKMNADGKPAVKDLTELLQDPNTHVRNAAIEALKRIDYAAWSDAVDKGLVKED